MLFNTIVGFYHNHDILYNEYSSRFPISDIGNNRYNQSQTIFKGGKYIDCPKMVDKVDYRVCAEYSHNGW